jgi:hypothetical protein
MSIHLYDRRATALANRVASDAISVRNRLIAECGDQPLDMRAICCWIARSEAQRRDAEWRMLAYEALTVVEQAALLDRTIDACPEHGA